MTIEVLQLLFESFGHVDSWMATLVFTAICTNINSAIESCW